MTDISPEVSNEFGHNESKRTCLWLKRLPKLVPTNIVKEYTSKTGDKWGYRDWETDRKSTRLNSSHSGESRMPSSA